MSEKETTKKAQKCEKRSAKQSRVQAESVKVDAGELVLHRRQNEKRSGESR